MPRMPSDKLTPEHTALLDRADKLGVSTFGYAVPNARIDKLRQLVENAERELTEAEAVHYRQPEFYKSDPPEPVGTLDDALGVMGQLQDELEAIGPLENPVVQAYYRRALRYTHIAKNCLERAIAADNEAHPEENDVADTTQQPVDRNTPFYVIIEFTKPVSELLLRNIVDTCGDFYSEDAPPPLSNTVKKANRATFDGFGHHVAVEPVLGNDPSYTE